MASRYLTLDSSVLLSGQTKFSDDIETLCTKANQAGKIIISSMVLAELQKNMSKNIYDKLKRIEGDTNYLSEVYPEYSIKLEIDRSEIYYRVKKYINEFIERHNIEEIIIDRDDVTYALDLYMKNLAPFQETGKKRYEFKDALILCSINHFGIFHGQKIIAISKDQDWKRFSENDDCMIKIEEPAQAIRLFLQPSEAWKARLPKLFARFDTKDLIEILTPFLERKISDYSMSYKMSHVFDNNTRQELVYHYSVSDILLHFADNDRVMVDDDFVYFVLSINGVFDAESEGLDQGSFYSDTEFSLLTFVKVKYSGEEIKVKDVQPLAGRFEPSVP